MSRAIFPARLYRTPSPLVFKAGEAVRSCLFFLLVIITLTLAGACLGPFSNTTFNSMGLQAAAGRSIFATDCSGCHGNRGQGSMGPPLIGPNNNLGKYQTAQGLLNFISLAMPQKAPGSLSSQEYTQVLAFLLTLNQFARSDSPFDTSQFGNIILK